MSNDKPDYYAMAEGISKTIGKVTKPLTDAQFIALAGAVAVYVEKALTHAAEKQAGPVAARYDFDGYGWRYIDNGSGSDWQTRHPDAELLYTTQPSPLTEQDKEDAERYRYWRDEIPWAQAQAICAHKGKAADDAIDAHRAARAKKEQQ